MCLLGPHFAAEETAARRGLKPDYGGLYCVDVVRLKPCCPECPSPCASGCELAVSWHVHKNPEVEMSSGHTLRCVTSTDVGTVRCRGASGTQGPLLFWAPCLTLLPQTLAVDPRRQQLPFPVPLSFQINWPGSPPIHCLIQIFLHPHCIRPNSNNKPLFHAP